MSDKEYLLSAARQVDAQLAANPDFAIPVDPDVAEFMGAFVESSLVEEDLDLRGGENEQAS